VIVAAGLTPAWQRIMIFDRLTLGEVQRARDVAECISGKVTNAAVAARCMGGDVTAILPIGPNVAEITQRELGELGITCDFVPITEPTRTCVTVIEQQAARITELVEDATRISEAELADFAGRLCRSSQNAEIVVFSGSLPRGMPQETYRDLLCECRVPIVADFRGPGLLRVLPLRPLLVKPNRAELQATLGKSFRDDRELLEGMRELCRRGAVWTLVSQGAAPVWLVSEGEVYRFEPPAPETIVNPIGCGDALAGAVAWAVANGCSVPDAVRLGIAAAQDNLRSLLPCRLDPSWVEEHADRIAVIRIA